MYLNYSNGIHVRLKNEIMGKNVRMKLAFLRILSFLDTVNSISIYAFGHFKIDTMYIGTNHCTDGIFIDKKTKSLFYPLYLKSERAFAIRQIGKTEADWTWSKRRQPISIFL